MYIISYLKRKIPGILQPCVASATVARGTGPATSFFRFLLSGDSSDGLLRIHFYFLPDILFPFFGSRMSGQVQRTYKEPTGITYTPAVNFTLSSARSRVFYIINNIVLIECSRTQHRTTASAWRRRRSVFILLLLLYDCSSLVFE